MEITGRRGGRKRSTSDRHWRLKPRVEPVPNVKKGLTSVEDKESGTLLKELTFMKKVGFITGSRGTGKKKPSRGRGFAQGLEVE